MVETSQQEATMDIAEMLEIMGTEAESLDNIYYEEGVVSGQPELVSVPKHILTKIYSEEKKVTQNTE